MYVPTGLTPVSAKLDRERAEFESLEAGLKADEQRLEQQQLHHQRLVATVMAAQQQSSTTSTNTHMHMQVDAQAGWMEADVIHNGLLCCAVLGVAY